MNLRLAKRVQLIKPSPTLTITARAAALKAAGKDIIGLGAGEPDFDTPEHIKQAAIKAIQAGFTKYTAVDGTPGLKKAIIAKFHRENGLEYTSDQILVSAGGKQSFYNLAQALLNAGDEVIIPAPYWVSYPDMVLLAEAEPVTIYAGIEQRFKITPRQLEAAITPKTRLLVMNSPSNPTGAIYSHDELAALGEVLRDHPQVLIASDDIYEHILLSDAPFCNILNACPYLYDRTVVINGVSKSFSMTGWRIGYAAGPKPLIEAMKNIQSQSTSNPASISQAAAQMALEGDQSFMEDWVRQFKERHEFVVKELNRIKGVQCLPSPGAFYSFPKMQGVIDGFPGIKDDVALAEYILNETGVALVPGSAFGAPGYMRLSFATSMENLREALARMQKLLGTVN
ncbi:MAG TPA: pyridoxal phosphate-dependent aminotransferase [Gammaproteobacteria bacterium]|nr:pyridoxal phosphate-dependent aminotransferase [Gammaproteobacteria bacterium]